MQKHRQSYDHINRNSVRNKLPIIMQDAFIILRSQLHKPIGHSLQWFCWMVDRSESLLKTATSARKREYHRQVVAFSSSLTEEYCLPIFCCRYLRWQDVRGPGCQDFVPQFKQVLGVRTYNSKISYFQYEDFDMNRTTSLYNSAIQQSIKLCFSRFEGSCKSRYN